MIDLDKIEAKANRVKDAGGDKDIFNVNHVLELCAEIRRLRAALKTHCMGCTQRGA
jgi:hypothetical protein